MWPVVLKRVRVGMRAPEREAAFGQVWILLLEAFWHCIGRPTIRLYREAIAPVTDMIVGCLQDEFKSPLSCFMVQVFKDDGILHGQCLVRNPLVCDFEVPKLYLDWLRSLRHLAHQGGLPELVGDFCRILEAEKECLAGDMPVWFFHFSELLHDGDLKRMPKSTFFRTGISPDHNVSQFLGYILENFIGKRGPDKAEEDECCREIFELALKSTHLLAHTRSSRPPKELEDLSYTMDPATDFTESLPKSQQRHVLCIGDWVDGKPIKVFHPDYIVDSSGPASQVGRLGWKLQYRVHRRGHWRNQPVGKRGSGETKRVWITEHWMGPEEAAIGRSPYDIDELGGASALE